MIRHFSTIVEGWYPYKLKTTDVPDWSNYTTVYIGYPIWWGEAAWPVNAFVCTRQQFQRQNRDPVLHVRQLPARLKCEQSGEARFNGRLEGRPSVQFIGEHADRGRLGQAAVLNTYAHCSRGYRGRCS